jgi:hypothetical protein
VVVFVFGALLSDFWIDENTVCPALECEGETYVPWWEWMCVAIVALGVAIFSLRRAPLSILLIAGGGLLWFM